jgi:hypothetical protein
MSAAPRGFEVAVVGGEPAGMSARIISFFRGPETAVLEGITWGGLLSTIYQYKPVLNVPGIPRFSHPISFQNAYCKQRIQIPRLEESRRFLPEEKCLWQKINMKPRSLS